MVINAKMSPKVIFGRPSSEAYRKIRDGLPYEDLNSLECTILRQDFILPQILVLRTVSSAP